MPGDEVRAEQAEDGGERRRQIEAFVLGRLTKLLLASALYRSVAVAWQGLYVVALWSKKMSDALV